MCVKAHSFSKPSLVIFVTLCTVSVVRGRTLSNSVPNDVHFNQDDFTLGAYGNVTNLESLVLQLIDTTGPQVCLSPVSKAVMRGIWRKNSPQDDELNASVALRARCYKEYPNAFFPTVGQTSPPANMMIRGSTCTGVRRKRARESPAEVLHKIVKPGNYDPGKSGKGIKNVKNNQENSVLQPDADTLQKANEILKDKSADCKPRKISVEIPKDPNPMIRLMPGCALIERCGGCCKHEALECVPDPNGITIVRKKVVAMSTTASQMTIKQVSIEKHSKCRCECKVKAQHCNERQSYDAKNCRCICRTDENGKPIKGRPTCSEPLYWDDATCRCRCPPSLVTECSTGSYYDTQICRCVTADDILVLRSMPLKP